MSLPWARYRNDYGGWAGGLLVVAIVTLAGQVFLLGPMADGRRTDVERERVAQQRLADAVAAVERERAGLRNLVAGREALGALFTEALPRDLDGARQATYVRVAELADEYGLRSERRSYEVDSSDADAALGRVRIGMVLEGSYPRIKEFIHAVESLPAFIVIDEVVLAAGAAPGTPLALTVRLSAYYQAPRLEAGGAGL